MSKPANTKGSGRSTCAFASHENPRLFMSEMAPSLLQKGDTRRTAARHFHGREAVNVAFV
jgi:hypothetical protein